MTALCIRILNIYNVGVEIHFYEFKLFYSRFRSLFRSVLSETYRRKVETCTLHNHENDNDFLFDNFSPLDHLNAICIWKREGKNERKMKYRIETWKKTHKKRNKIFISKRKSTCKKEHMQIHENQIIRSEIGWCKNQLLFLFLAHRKKALKYGQTVKMNKCKNESIEREQDTRGKKCAAIISHYFFHIRKNKNQIASISHERRQQQNGAKKNQKNNLSICTLYGIQCTRINVIPTNKMQNSFLQMNYNKTTSIPAEKSAANNV